MACDISAILLAAGESQRMGHPKALLPWGGITVLEQIASVFAAAGIRDIVIVTGGARKQVEALVLELGKVFPVRAVFNPKYAIGEMLNSIQIGLEALGSKTRAAIIGLGDQPQIHENVVRRICTAFVQTNKPLIIPSFNNRRGHPWLMSRSAWPEFMALSSVQTPRDFLNKHGKDIFYLPVETESILLDLDTPQDYISQRPQ